MNQTSFYTIFEIRISYSIYKGFVFNSQKYHEFMNFHLSLNFT